jgi:hypothetical protein
MSLTVFDVLAHPLSQRQTVHNVRLLEVRPAEDGQERLILEHEGVQESESFRGLRPLCSFL